MSKLTPREEYREANKELWAEMEAHLDRLIALRDSVKIGDKILLVGPNASGKSLFRKVLQGSPLLKDQKIRMVHASMALRTGNFASMGALSSMFADHGDDATSNASIKLLEGAIRNCGNWTKEGNFCGLHLDEPEVGCSEEVQLGMGTWLRDKIDAMETAPAITMVTTHSRHIAKQFQDWKFIDTGFEYNSAEEWVNREIKPVDPESIHCKARTLFLVIIERTEKNKTP